VKGNNWEHYQNKGCEGSACRPPAPQEGWVPRPQIDHAAKGSFGPFLSVNLSGAA
jgi:hypothetical protein